MNKLIAITLVLLLALSLAACDTMKIRPTKPDETPIIADETGSPMELDERLVLGEHMGWNHHFDKGFIWYSFQANGSYQYIDATHAHDAGEGTWSTHKGVLMLSNGTEYAYSLRGEVLVLRDAEGNRYNYEPMGEPIVD